MSFAPQSVMFGVGDGSVRGEFRNRESDAFFQFSSCPKDEQAFGPEFNMKVWMCDGSFRFAKVMKSRVRVVVDEAPNGSPVVEVWEVKQRRDFEVPA